MMVTLRHAPKSSPIWNQPYQSLTALKCFFLIALALMVWDQMNIKLKTSHPKEFVPRENAPLHQVNSSLHTKAALYWSILNEQACPVAKKTCLVANLRSDATSTGLALTAIILENCRNTIRALGALEGPVSVIIIRVNWKLRIFKLVPLIGASASAAAPTIVTVAKR